MGRKPLEPDTSTWRGQVGAHLRELRLRANRTQSELAERIAYRQGVGGTYDRKIGKATISQWELGTHQPRIDDLPALSAALGVSIPELLPKFHFTDLDTPPSVQVRKPRRRARSSKKRLAK